MITNPVLAVVLHEDLNDYDPPLIMDYDVPGASALNGSQFLVLSYQVHPDDKPYVGMSVQLTLTGWGENDNVCGYRAKLPAGIKALHTEDGVPCILTSKMERGYDESMNQYLAHVYFADIQPFKVNGIVRIIDPEELNRIK